MNNQKVIDYFGGDTMAADVWQDKYQLKDNQGNPTEETPADMHKRLATEFARVEHKYYEEFERLLTTEQFNNLSDFGQRLMAKRSVQTEEGIANEFFDYFDKFSQIVPQGSIMSNLGNYYKYGSLSNCFGITPPVDSYGGIHKTDEELTQLMKRRGGVGTHLNNLRFSDAPVTNAAKTSSGVPSFAERFSNTTREVAQEGRRGALMLLLSCKHPDIFKFVKMKDDKTKVTGANVSVMFTDDFMYAVEYDQDFLCTFPVNLPFKLNPSDFYNFDYNQIYEMKSYQDKKFWIMRIRAKELFDLVAEMAHKNAEPGVAYENTIIDYCPDGVYEMYIPQLCNPCGEQWFHANETCRLIAANLWAIVVNHFRENAFIDYNLAYEIFYMQQRLGDNLVELEVQYIDRILSKLEKDPEPEEIKATEINLWKKIRKIADEGRRTGNGFTALGDMIAALNLSYASEESMEVIAKVMQTKMKAELDATIDMAISRGTFTGWNKWKEFDMKDIKDDRTGYYQLKGKNSFYNMLFQEFPEQATRMWQHGRRNVSWSTVAPTGTVSIMTQTTGGIEPLFKAYYIRRRKINPSEPDARVDFTDQNGDKWTEYAVLHPKFREWIKKQFSIGSLEFSGFAIMDFSTDEPAKIIPFNPEDLPKEKIQELFEKSPWYKSEADDVDHHKRIIINSIVQRYTSNAISCTINLPKDVDVSVIKEIYFEAWKKNLKGVTVYREGSRSGVLVNETAPLKTNEFGYVDAVPRPEVLEADYYYVKPNGHDFAVIVGKLNGLPYELFAYANPGRTDNVKGQLIKVESGHYKFVSSHFEIDNVQVTEHPDEALLCRFVSGMLRHRMNPKYIADQVDKVPLLIVSFGKAVQRVLKQYIPDEATGEMCDKCNQATIVRQEGCKKCSNCGESKC